MSSHATKQAETEFDDLLGQLVDELAMTPASQSAVALVPDLERAPPPTARVDSSQEAGAAVVGVLPPTPASNATIKIVGIIAASLTAIAVAALVTFGGGADPRESAPAVAQDDAAEQQEIAEASASYRLAAEQAQLSAMAVERAELEAAHARLEAERLGAQLAASEAAAAKPQAKPRNRNRNKPKPKPKPKPGDPGSDFDKL
jgi:hypothetical protein